MVRDRSRRWSESRLTLLQSGPQDPKFVLEIRGLSGVLELFDDLGRAPVLDYLTGTLNRTSLFERAQSLLDRLRAAGERLGVMVIAADGIGAINTRSGTQAGDEALRRLVRKVQPSLGPGDLFARLGSDRFCLLLPGHDTDATVRLAERLRADLHDANLVSRTATPTASFGVAHDDGTTAFAHLLARAEQGARHAKMAGRDCVSVSSAA